MKLCCRLTYQELCTAASGFFTSTKSIFSLYELFRIGSMYHLYDIYTSKGIMNFLKILKIKQFTNVF